MDGINNKIAVLNDIISALDASVIVAITDQAGKITYVNDKFCEISQYSKGELVGQNHRILKSGYHGKEFYQDMWNAVSSGSVWRGEIKNKAKDGSYYWVETAIVPFLDRHKTVYQYIAIRTNITRVKQLEEDLRNALINDFENITKNLNIVMFKVSKRENQMIFKMFEGKLVERFQLKTNEIIGKTCEECFAENVAIKLEKNLVKAFSGFDTVFELNILKNYFHVTLSPIFISGEVIEVIGSAVDINKLKKSENRIKFLAFHDELTQMPNRHMLRQDFKKILNQLSERQKLSIMMLDLDRFKEINDTFGHDYGDHFLLEVSNRLKQLTHQYLRVYRFGGDEFVVMQIYENDHELQKVIDLIFQCFEKPFFKDDFPIYCSASLGIALFPEHGLTDEMLIKNADAAMYQAKLSGRNLYKIYGNEMSVKRQENFKLETELRKAIKEKDFILYYQPRYDLNRCQIIGAEALIRWIHPEKGMIMPSEFIPLAEETGLIISISEFVLLSACQQLKKWEKILPDSFRLSINICSYHFQQRNFLQLIDRIISDMQISPKNLEFEITENTLVKDTNESQHMLEELKSRGISISIDDFGKGYSSLVYLKKLKVNTLKIDRYFIKNLQSSNEDRAIVNAIIQLAKYMELEVVAEGVENEHILHSLNSMGCNLIQGFYFYRPLSVQLMEEVLNSNHFKK